MLHTLPAPTGGAITPALTEALREAESFAELSKSKATRKAYDADWRHFVAWCHQVNAQPLPAPPEVVCAYLSQLAGRGFSAATIDRRAAAIACIHRLRQHNAPTGDEAVRSVLQGIRKTLGRRPKKKQALTVDLLTKVLRRIKPDLAGLRDRALLLVCFGAALRRSELVALDIEDLERQRRGLIVRIGKSKTDQEGRGQSVAVPNGKLKVADAVDAWCSAAGITSGALFRGINGSRISADRLSDRQFARILQSRCAAAGLDPSRFGGHSCRSGFATTAGDAGADLRKTAGHLRHVKLETTIGYMQDGELFKDHAGKGFL